MDYDDPVESHEALRFLEEYTRDREAGAARSLDEYLARFPDHPHVIRREYAAVCPKADAPAASADDGGIARSPSAEESSSGLALPLDFGPYELLEEIGRGGMGVVFKARQKELDRVVAIKMILAQHLAHPQHVERFRTEARAAAGLRHAHIVHIHEVGQFRGQHYFAMEYVEGDSLAAPIRSGPMEPPKAARLVAQVARAVGHFHHEGIIHRDLKPSNILLDCSGRPYVTDFGLAKAFREPSEMTFTGEVLGTASYMAPEQAMGRSAEAGPACDVYSLGAILYELLTGRPPFRADNLIMTVMQVRTREPVLPRRLNRDVPRGLELICLKCLAKAPEERYATGEALADDLDRFLKGEPLGVRPPTPGQRLWNWCRREPALAGRLAVLAVFFLIEMLVNALTWHSYWIHEPLLGILAVWAFTAYVFQRVLESPRWSIPSRFMWGTLDSAFLFAVLLLANGVASPLVIGYPLLIAASGLWFRMRFVWFITGLSLVSYGIHVADFYARRIRSDLSDVLDDRWDRHLVFAVGLLCTGAIVAYIVHRVQVLRGYFSQPE